MSTEQETLNALCTRKNKVFPVYLNQGGQPKTLYVKVLYGDSFEAFTDVFENTANKLDRYIGILRMTLCDANGELLITTDEQAAAIATGMSLGNLIKLGNRGAEINGFTTADEDDEGN